MSSKDLEGYFDVKKFGATGNGIDNDSIAIQKAIDAAQAKGGVVWFPPGTYRIGPGPRSDRGIFITAPVILAGTGAGTRFGIPPQTDHISTAGSKLFVTNTDIIPIWITGQGTVVRDLAIYHQQDDPQPGKKWKPLPYPQAIYAYGADIRLENIFLRNPTTGIACTNTGRLSVNRLFGQPLETGIRLDNLQDTTRIDNVHFWRYWSSDPAVSEYMFEQAVGIKSYRNDNPMFSNIFTIGYNIGFLFSKGDNPLAGDSLQITSKFKILNADNDGGYIGIKVDGPNTTGHIVNYSFQGYKESETGIHIQAPGSVIQATNVRITLTGANAVRVSGQLAHLLIDNIWVEAWDQSGKGFPGIEAVDDGAVVSVGFNRYFYPLQNSRRVGGQGTVALAGPILPGINS